MEKEDKTIIAEIKKDIADFSRRKDLKKSVEPYRSKANELLKLDDGDLLRWYEENGRKSYVYFVFNDIEEKKDASKYKRLSHKIEEGEDLTDNEIEFIESYEEAHNISNSIW